MIFVHKIKKGNKILKKVGNMKHPNTYTNQEACKILPCFINSLTVTTVTTVTTGTTGTTGTGTRTGTGIFP